jgi:chloramphenicol O-acetyltransferase type B
VKIGKFTYIVGEINVRFPDGRNLDIGNFCSIAEDVVIFLGGEHNTKSLSTYPFDHRMSWPVTNDSSISKGNVSIKNDVWIGKGTVILSGITIEDGAVIGAYSVVTKSIPPYEIWAGNPARKRKERFDLATICKLQEMKWWDWPDNLIREASLLLSSNDINGLYDYYQRRIKGE